MNEKLLQDVMPRRVMTLFLLVDSSGSMSINGNIGKVNSAIEEMIPLLKEVSDENADAEIRVAVLDFSSGCQWVTHDPSGQPGAESLEGFFWNDLSAGGLTDMGAAFAELETRLSRSSFLASSTGAYAPVIILLSDGQPTDNWEAGLEKLKHNNWYKNATRIAIAVDKGDVSVLAAFTGSTESVLQVNSNRDDLKKLLCRLALISSTMASRSSPVDPTLPPEEAKTEQVRQIIRDTLEDGKTVPLYTDNEPLPDDDGGAFSSTVRDWGEGW